MARQVPAALPQLEAEARDEHGRRAGVNAIATTIWNASPLPSNAYRPRPLPAPGRNEPCPCGSGQKFKRCCGRVAPAWPSLPQEDVWVLLVPHLTKGELRRFANDPALPPAPLALVALEMKDRGQAGAARAALAHRLERSGGLDARDEPALDALFDLEAEARDVDDFLRWASSFADRLPRRLKTVAYRHLVPAALSIRRTDVAHLLLDRIRQSSADEPALGPLEVMTLLTEGELAPASERARFWLAWLRRRGLGEEVPEAFEMLEQAARAPDRPRTPGERHPVPGRAGAAAGDGSGAAGASLRPLSRGRRRRLRPPARQRPRSRAGVADGVARSEAGPRVVRRRPRRRGHGGARALARRPPKAPGGVRQPERPRRPRAPRRPRGPGPRADPLVCRRCGGALKVVAYITDAMAIRQILEHLDLSPPEKPPPDIRDVVRVPVDEEGREFEVQRA